MIRRRRPPTRIPATPWSQPGMTCPAPRRKLKGSPRFQDASNSRWLDHATPTYCTSTVEPAVATGPVPTTRSLLWSVAGGAPAGTVTVGRVSGAWFVVVGGVVGGVSGMGCVGGVGVTTWGGSTGTALGGVMVVVF